MVLQSVLSASSIATSPAATGCASALFRRIFSFWINRFVPQVSCIVLPTLKTTLYNLICSEIDNNQNSQNLYFVDLEPTVLATLSTDLIKQITDLKTKNDVVAYNKLFFPYLLAYVEDLKAHLQPVSYTHLTLPTNREV